MGNMFLVASFSTKLEIGTLQQVDSRYCDKARTYWTPERVTRVTGGKNLHLLPNESPALLRTMGLLNADGSMADRSVSKYRQINHLLAMIGPRLLPLAERHRPLYILDACCGNSFLSLLVIWFLSEKHGIEIRLVGLDRNESVVAASRERIASLGWGDRAVFATGDISLQSWATAVRGGFAGNDGAVPLPNAVIALHACDTASDDALALGVECRADLIAVAPCCQGELARAWKLREGTVHPMRVFFETPTMRRETAAQVTDGMRMLLMQGQGYDTSALEFVPSDHTPKNRLILCERKCDDHNRAGVEEYHTLREHSGGDGIHLAAKLLGGDYLPGSMQ